MGSADVRVLGDVAGIVAGASAAIYGASDSTLLVGGGIGAVFLFAGVLVKQIFDNQSRLLEIIAEKDKTIAYRDVELRDERYRNEHLEWEREKLRWTYGDRATDPGPPPTRETT